MAHEQLVHTADEAVVAARAAGLPVVLKLEVEGLAHKTEAGGVALDLRTEAEVLQAYETFLGIVDSKRLGANFKGVLVQPMVSKGLEIIAGARIDPQVRPDRDGGNRGHVRRGLAGQRVGFRTDRPCGC